MAHDVARAILELAEQRAVEERAQHLAKHSFMIEAYDTSYEQVVFRVLVGVDHRGLIHLSHSFLREAMTPTMVLPKKTIKQMMSKLCERAAHGYTFTADEQGRIRYRYKDPVHVMCTLSINAKPIATSHVDVDAWAVDHVLCKEVIQLIDMACNIELA